MTPAYLIVEMNITDMEQYKLYMTEAPAAVKARSPPSPRR